MPFPIPRCDGCGRTLTEPGAVVFGPPTDPVSGAAYVAKYHLCVLCWGYHYVHVDDGDWTMEHPFQCRLSGGMHLCTTHIAWTRWARGNAPPEGRWLVDGFTDGIPDLIPG